MKPNNIILEGVTGSTAYGLATINSDIDIKGIYQLPLREVLSMGFTNEHNTFDHTDPDWCYHELGKFMKLVAGGNPTYSELLWLEDYTVMTPAGHLLITNRQYFLSTNAVRKAYSGYALGQAKKLNNRTEQGLEGYASSRKNRYAKHTRHCFRLMIQARQLLETGHLDVRVTKEQREWLFSMGDKGYDEVIETFMQMDNDLKQIKSVLPDKPDTEKLNDLLFNIRKSLE